MQRVASNVVLANFEVKVRPRRATTDPDVGDHLTTLHSVLSPHQIVVVVRVYSGEAVDVTHDDDVAVAAQYVAVDDDTVARGLHRCAHRRADVDPIMKRRAA